MYVDKMLEIELCAMAHRVEWIWLNHQKIASAEDEQ